MLKILLSFFVILLFNQSSLAHGPSRQKVSLKLDIKAPASKVWGIVSNFEEFVWNEEVEKSESNGNNVGSERVVSFKNGSKIKQKLEKINAEKMMVSWRVIETDNKALPVNSYAAKIFVKSVDSNTTNITYKSGFYRGFMGNDPPAELNDENSKIKVTKFIEGNLKGLKRIAEGN